MTLAAVRGGKIAAPVRVFLFGVEGVGKSTFAAGAPSPIFLGPEDGTHHLDVKRFPPPATWAEVFEALAVLEHEAHDFKTLAIDTVDWIEPLVWRAVCEAGGWASIEDAGYGKGYVKALDEWRRMLSALERLRATKRMHVVLLGHSQVKLYKNPEGDDFDRYALKLHDKAGGLLKEWSDVVLFANYETFAAKDQKTKRVRGVSSGARLIYTNRTAAYDAKNRYNLPDSLPLSWADFFEAVERRETAPATDLRAAIEQKIGELHGDVAKKAMEALARAGADAEKLAQLNSWVNAQTTTTPKEEAK